MKPTIPFLLAVLLSSAATLRDRSKLPLDPINFVQIGGHGILDPPGDPGATGLR